MTKNKLTKSLPKLSSKDKLILSILRDNPEGLRVLTIQKLLNLPSKTLYRHLNKLKELEILEKISIIWKICHFQATPLNMTKLLKNDNIQIHDISFVVQLIRIPNWWEKRQNNLRRLKEYQFKKNVDWGNNPYTQLIKDHFLIHCFKNSIVFINKKKYLGKDPYECFIESLNDFLESFRYFEERTRFKFFLDEVPQVSVKSNHIVKLRDYLSKRCEKKGDKFQVIINDEKRVLVDMSDPKGTEFVNKDYAPEDTQRYGVFVEDVIKNNPPTNSQLATHIQSVVANQNYHAENMKSHVNATKDLSQATKTLNKNLEKQTELFEKMATFLNKRM